MEREKSVPGNCTSCKQPLDAASLSSACEACGCIQVPVASQDQDDATRNTGTRGQIGPILLDRDFLQEFRPGRILGSGSMGLVIQATWIPHDKQVAVKFLAQADNPSLRRRFLQEGRLLGMIHHSNVMQIYGGGELGSIPYFIMEYLEGGTLRAFLDQAPVVKLDLAVRIIIDILHGIAGCHEKGIVHRDLKPENVLFSASGQAKVADLGIARSRGDLRSFTQSGAVLGTPKYMPPEQARGQSAGDAADLYAVGIILYEMLVGEAPFAGPSVPALMRQQVEDAPLPLTHFSADVPPEIVRIVSAALAKNPSERPKSAADMVAQLQPFVNWDGPPIGGSGTSRTVPAARPPATDAGTTAGAAATGAGPPGILGHTEMPQAVVFSTIPVLLLWSFADRRPVPGLALYTALTLMGGAGLQYLRRPGLTRLLVVSVLVPLCTLLSMLACSTAHAVTARLGVPAVLWVRPLWSAMPLAGCMTLLYIGVARVIGPQLDENTGFLLFSQSLWFVPHLAEGAPSVLPVVWTILTSVLWVACTFHYLLGGDGATTRATRVMRTWLWSGVLAACALASVHGYHGPHTIWVNLANCVPLLLVVSTLGSGWNQRALR
jgi:hypothetical protein